MFNKHDKIPTINHVLCHQALWNMLNMFQSMFGPHFWRNAILEATHWSHSSRLVSFIISDLILENGMFQSRIREAGGLTEDTWAKQFNQRLRKDFKFDFDLPAVFIDTFHNRKNQAEVEKFQQNVQILWEFAQSRLGKVVGHLCVQIFCPDLTLQCSCLLNMT